MRAAGHDLWVFGYGSLMWRPGFRHAERAPAVVTGYHRAFCIASTLHRGTRARPGLVLGLDRGGACAGIAYRVAAADAAWVLDYLRERELVYGVYRETWVTAELTGDGASDAHQYPRSLDGASDAHQHPRSLDGASDAHQHPRLVTALAYTVERCHPSYVGRMPLAAQAAIVRGARGRSGANLDYLINTVRHLQELGIRERRMERLMGLAAGYAANAPLGAEHRPSVRGLCATWARCHIPLPRVPFGDQRRFGHRITTPRA